MKYNFLNTSKKVILSLAVTSSLLLGTNYPETLAKVDFDQRIAEAQAWADNNFKVPDSLTNEEKQQINRYTGSTYDAINSYLLTNNGLGSDNKLNGFIDKITSGISKSKAPDDLTLYRRVTEKQFGLEYGDLRTPGGNGNINIPAYEKIKEAFTGKIITHHNFMSTSLAKDPHKSFGDRQAILLKINAPRNTEVLNVSSISKYPEQLELLVNRGYRIRYNNFSIIKSGIKEYVEVDVDILGK